MATISSPGLGSNLDVNSIVSQLMAIERQPITALDTRESNYQAQLSAYGSIKGAVASFQATMLGLSTPSRFLTTTASSSDTSKVGVSASGSPVAGSYSLEVTSLAQAQKLVAAGQASDTAQIGSGATTTLTFDFGTISGGSFNSGTGQYTGSTFASNGSGTKTVTIDSSNNTLAGIRDAINAASIGVTASIVNDGSASPYRLVLTNSATGANQSMKITASGDASVSALLSQDPEGTQGLAETVTAKSAALKVDGIAVTKSSNTITDAIPGLTLTLTDTTTSGSPVRVTVTQDRSGINSAVSGFVNAYNQLNSTLSQLTAYDATNQQASILTGDATVQSMQSQVRSMLSTALTGVPGNYTTLSQVGVSFQVDGTLSLDSSKLAAAVAADPNSVTALFAASGSTSDSQSSFAASTNASQPGTYPVTVTSFATQGKLVGSAAAATTITTGVNDTLSLEIDGVAASITLPAGTYTAAQLATQLQSSVNGVSAIASAGSSVAVAQSGGVLTVNSNRYGSASTVKITGGTAATDLFGTTSTSTAGSDIAGTINGVAATGSGQTLTGAKGSATEGLAVKIASGATGARGSIFFSRGFADRLQTLAATFLDTTGTLTSRTNGLNSTIKDIESQKAALELRMTDIEARYRAQFTALDTLMSNMTATSTYLQQQLANLPKISSN